MRLIDADALCELLDKHSEIYGEEEKRVSEYMKSLIQYAPTIDAKPVVHAHWERWENYPDWIHCSACGYEPPDDGGIWDVSDTNDMLGETACCPNCGAEMDEEAKE